MYNRFLELYSQGNDVFIKEHGVSKNRKPIVITRPDMDGILLAERICLAVNLTSYLSIEELRSITTRYFDEDPKRLVLFIGKDLPIQ